jgi:tetratricopeptide (TPR) repeat protein
MDRLAALHTELSRDDEVTLFYALSLYANSKYGADAARAKQAADLAEEVFKRNPNHPGAAHYLIHACDSPSTAARALQAAQRYAQIAPALGHALHMPSHIFVQLGMWRQVESSNIAAVKAGEDTVARRKQPISRADWHSFSWLASARLELGRADEVLPMIARVKSLSAGEASLRWVQAELALKYLSATGEYARMDELMAMPPLAAEDETGYVDTQRAYEGCHHAPYELMARMSILRARLDATTVDGDDEHVAAIGEEMRALRGRVAKQSGGAYNSLGELIVAAKIAQAKSVRDTGTIGEAISATRAAADAEDAMPRSGPFASTPMREELGELLLRSHRFQEAEEAFQASLEKRPGRFHALEGLAEAARSAGDMKTAEDAQGRLSAQIR